MRPSGNWVMLRTLFPPKPSVPLIGVKTQYFSAMAGNESIIAFLLYFFILDINTKTLVNTKVKHFWGFINRR